MPLPLTYHDTNKNSCNAFRLTVLIIILWLPLVIKGSVSLAPQFFFSAARKRERVAKEKRLRSFAKCDLKARLCAPCVSYEPQHASQLITKPIGRPLARAFAFDARPKAVRSPFLLSRQGLPGSWWCGTEQCPLIPLLLTSSLMKPPLTGKSELCPCSMAAGIRSLRLPFVFTTGGKDNSSPPPDPTTNELGDVDEEADELGVESVSDLLPPPSSSSSSEIFHGGSGTSFALATAFIIFLATPGSDSSPLSESNQSGLQHFSREERPMFARGARPSSSIANGTGNFSAGTQRNSSFSSPRFIHSRSRCRPGAKACASNQLL
jgi:hypothetical protein